MKAVIFHRAGQPLAIETVADPEPAADEVVVAIRHAGICGSDLHMTQQDWTPEGLILGHEYAGTIAAVGSNAGSRWNVGESVTALPLFPCRSCEACDALMPQLCPNGHFAGTSLERPGAYAEYIVARADMLQKVPAGVNDAEAAMIEPLAVGHHIVDRAGILPGEAVLIIGGGPIGAAVALFARMAGASHVIVSEPSPERRARCMDLGATAVIDPTSEVLTRRIHEIAGTGPAVVFECVGTPGMVQLALDLVALRGRVVVAGVLIGEDRLSHIGALGKEASVIYSQAYVERDFAAVIDALAQGRVDARPMHTSTIGFAEVPEIFESLRSNPAQCKVLIDPSL